jgi:hypothetical protein
MARRHPGAMAGGCDRTLVINWHGLLIEGWQPIDDTTPRYPLPDDCRP